MEKPKVDERIELSSIVFVWRKSRNIQTKISNFMLTELNNILNTKIMNGYNSQNQSILFGNGTKLFKDGRPEQKLELVSTKQFGKGLTQLHCKRKDD